MSTTSERRSARWQIILVPTDFSFCSDEALGLAASLASLHGAQLLLLHCVELPPGIDSASRLQPEGYDYPVTVEDFTRKEAERKLYEQAKRILGEGYEWRGQIRLGPIVETIIDAVDKHRAELIVIGTHGRTGFRHFLLGSVAERVVRASPVPVLTVRSTNEPPKKEEEPAT